MRADGVIAPGTASHNGEQSLHRAAKTRARAWGAGLALILSLAWLSVIATVRDQANPPFIFSIAIALAGLLAEALLAIAAGQFVGRALQYAGLVEHLGAAGVGFQPVPGHADGLSGLRPLVRLWAGQVLMVALVANYLAVWLFLIIIDRRIGVEYSAWRTPYSVLLAVMIVLEITLTARPLRGLGRLPRTVARRAFPVLVGSLVAANIVPGYAAVTALLGAPAS
jgi:hypothetical protein